jgi:proteasome lid subunit RPN8/RPN11
VIEALLDPSVLDAIRLAAGEAAPDEACGALLGTAGERVHISAFRRLRNLAERHDRFLVDPGDLWRADAEARALGLQLVGVFHSHPDGVARPSSRDAAFAALWGRMVWVIGGRDGEQAAFVFGPDGRWLDVLVVSSAAP